MTDLQALLKTAHEGNNGHGVIPLADAMQEAGDVRGEIVAKHLADPYPKTAGWPERTVRDFMRSRPARSADHITHVGDGDDQFSISHHMYAIPEDKKHVLMEVKHGKMRDGEGSAYVSGYGHYAFLPVDEARRIADQLPNTADMHKFLDSHFGKDSRTAKFAASYNKALKNQ